MFGHEEEDKKKNKDMPSADGTLGTVEPSASPALDIPAIDDKAAKDFMTDNSSRPAAISSTNNADDLLALKQQALQQLSPLVGHLNQTPEEKFRTLMMMIQAADDSSLIKDAYEAAKDIPDEKVRAQALLDVVNEINYFTQQQNS